MALIFISAMSFSIGQLVYLNEIKPPIFQENKKLQFLYRHKEGPFKWNIHTDSVLIDTNTPVMFLGVTEFYNDFEGLFLKILVLFDSVVWYIAAERNLNLNKYLRSIE